MFSVVVYKELAVTVLANLVQKLQNYSMAKFSIVTS